MRRDAEQHVLEIGERRDADQFAALDERVQQCRAASPFKAASKEPVLPTDRDESELILGTVVIDSQAAILNETVIRVSPEAYDAFMQAISAPAAAPPPTAAERLRRSPPWDR